MGWAYGSGGDEASGERTIHRAIELGVGMAMING